MKHIRLKLEEEVPVDVCSCWPHVTRDGWERVPFFSFRLLEGISGYLMHDRSPCFHESATADFSSQVFGDLSNGNQQLITDMP